MNNVKNRTSQELVDFGLFYTAKEFYEAAKLIKSNTFVRRPYHVLLSFSIELLLKSIKTTIVWSGSTASQVKHTEGHALVKIFNSIEQEHPKDAEYLVQKYASKYGCSLKHDLELNSEVFTKQRYPYHRNGNIPSMSKVSIDCFDIQYGNDIAVYVDELERVADFLHDELIVYFPGLFDKVEKHS
ncbi:hypothetical protein IB288_23075 [Vibrio parahaemolyticus]|uniref:hypothetical protein n=1 Tax=Vibrio parahaemolyticus TaxID=670 RepID=UPI001D161156|nr:hypothetical protein [Vibrio parahaemolyticus]MCC3845837.1 hypothetical protein [Vibrio parahaemolyticus]